MGVLVQKDFNYMKSIIPNLEVDLSDKISAKFYPVEETDTCIVGAERFGGKKRGALKDSDFIDPKRRSFPVMSCKDVKDAVSTWGMYKGPMSFATFKSKLKSRAKSLGCESSLPKNWSEKTDAKSKKDWEKTDKKELDRDTKKEKGEHEKDAVKDDKSKVDKLKKGKQTEKKQVEEHDLKKDEEFDKEDKTKYTKADDAPWEDKDEKELKKDTKKEKKEHEKDAVKDDKKQIKDLKKDVKEDKKDAKKDG